ncbi:MAG: hypothetical protein U0796_14530 [Gemmatales bacterium]
MAKVIRDDLFRVDIGRASGGQTFVRVIHQPTGIARVVVGLAGRDTRAVTTELRDAIVGELLGRGWCRSE